MPTGVYKRKPITAERKEQLRQRLREINSRRPKGTRISPKTEFKKGNIPWNKGKKFLQVSGENNPMKRPEIREKIRLSKLGNKNPMWGKKGELHHNWKGGRTPLIMQIRNSPQYAEWREKVYQQDNYTCLICKDSRGHNLNAHHCKPLSIILRIGEINNFKQALNCPEIWDIKNGATFCINCHPIIQEVIKCLN